MKKTLISLTLATLMTSGLASAMPSEGKVRADMGITESNLLAADQNRYTYKNMQEFMKTKNIDSGVMAPILLEQADKPLGDVDFTYDGKKMNLQDMLKDHRADAFIVLKDGKVVHEQYFDGQNERTKHQMMSVTKSFTGILAATLVAEGKLDRDALVETIVPELKGSAYGDATVGQVMDMTNNVKYSEAYENPNAEVFQHMKTIGFAPMEEGYAGPKTIRDFLITLEKDGDRPHGEEFHYISANTDVVAWIIENVEGKSFDQIMSERIWSKIGAERDAFVIVDGEGTELASGGLNATARDLAKFGQMLADQGKNLNGEQVLPAKAIQSTQAGGAPEAFEKGGYSHHGMTGWSYRNQFWHTDNANQAYTALGIFGQWIYVDPTENVVIVRQSSAEASIDDIRDAEMVSAVNAIIEKLK
ncbi:serine hydrolase domain-containing protein [Vibrio maritimus]|uniref:serine hydrolase domain-containing protein n=1 Tax=Vibrio maritimus TaxID=990268 RepID=UPI001F35A526|nr:serine hydrolase [Vibrio maritimus]